MQCTDARGSGGSANVQQSCSSSVPSVTRSACWHLHANLHLSRDAFRKRAAYCHRSPSWFPLHAKQRLVRFAAAVCRAEDNAANCDSSLHQKPSRRFWTHTPARELFVKHRVAVSESRGKAACSGVNCELSPNSGTLSLDQGHVPWVYTIHQSARSEKDSKDEE